jgi:hypothetical protein
MKARAAKLVLSVGNLMLPLMISETSSAWSCYPDLASGSVQNKAVLQPEAMS